MCASLRAVLQALLGYEMAPQWLCVVVTAFIGH